MTGLYIALGHLLSLLCGMAIYAALDWRRDRREDARDLRAEEWRDSAVAADWRPATNDISLWPTMRLPLVVVPVQRVSVEAAA